MKGPVWPLVSFSISFRQKPYHTANGGSQWTWSITRTTLSTPLNPCKTKQPVSFNVTITTSQAFHNLKPTWVSPIGCHAERFLVFVFFTTLTIMPIIRSLNFKPPSFISPRHDNTLKVQPIMARTNRYKYSPLVVCITDWTRSRRTCGAAKYGFVSQGVRNICDQIHGLLNCSFSV